jgi:redox-sensitive bicupin YhaK (pirin superfamily)
MNQQQRRGVSRTISGRETSDGAGVRLSRKIGGPELSELDPFLLLDEFRSDDPEDYIAGFPPHPHRGFETVTYLLAGCMQHRDSAGHAGVIKAGGVQWMTAGRGIVHSEMPQQEEGLLAGFQLWVNLPAEHKMIAPRYQEFGPEAIPTEVREGGVEVRTVAGTTSAGTKGPVTELLTPVVYLDVSLPAGSRFEEPVDPGFNGFVYVAEGRVEIEGTPVEAGALALLGPGAGVVVRGEAQSRLLIIAGNPLNEPVARHGPFVMNTEAQLRQAFEDYRNGTLGAPAQHAPEKQ